MIKGLYETHLFVKNLEVSIDFYKNVLGLEQCYFEEERRTVFFWIGEPKQAMLGLWEKPKSQIDKQHFAFRCDKEIYFKPSNQFLKWTRAKTVQLFERWNRQTYGFCVDACYCNLF